ncbi:MAG: dephospho-CoA kinase, partial [Lactiplantibacillus plantarum]
MTKLIGLTGGIATGKSTVSKLLATKLPIVDADKIAWQVEGPG